MDFQREKRAFERDGFVVVRQFLPGEELQELMANLDRYIREAVPTLPEEAAFYHDRKSPETLKQLQHLGRDAWFNGYRRNARWNGLAEALVGEPVEAEQPEWFNKPPGMDHLTPPHQDNWYFCLKPSRVVTLWLALDHVDEESGCLRYVAGSHRSGLRPHATTGILGFSQGITDYGPADSAREVQVPLQPGDLVAHHGETIHRADANHSADRHRRAFAMVFRDRSCRRDQAAYQRYQQALKQQHRGMGLRT